MGSRPDCAGRDLSPPDSCRSARHQAGGAGRHPGGDPGTGVERRALAALVLPADLERLVGRDPGSGRIAGARSPVESIRNR